MRRVLTLLAVLVLVAAIGVGALNHFAQRPGPGPDPRPVPGNPPGCVAAEVLAAPGTWESRADDDPLAPSANPHSLLLTITGPLREAYPAERVGVWTLPYPAQFRNINALQEMTYDDSQAAGRARLEEELRATHEACPATDFILVGFSQGAVIAGDVAAAIGAGAGPVPAERVAGVALIADGRRDPAQSATVSVPVAGVGLELALAPLNAAVQPIVPGATMRGPRPGGFGELTAKVAQICAPADAVCDAPPAIGDALARARDYAGGNAVHAAYTTNPEVFPDATTPEWVIGWARGLIDAALAR